MTLAKLSMLEAILGFDRYLATISTNEVDTYRIYAHRYKNVSACKESVQMRVNEYVFNVLEFC